MNNSFRSTYHTTLFKTSKKVVSVNLFGKNKKIVIRKNEKDLNQNKQAQAIIPNIIHSLDASHLISILLEGLTCFMVLIIIMGANLNLAGIINFN